MDEHDKIVLKQFINEHEVDFNGVRFVNALWLEREIDEMYAESDREETGSGTGY